MANLSRKRVNWFVLIISFFLLFTFVGGYHVQATENQEKFEITKSSIIDDTNNESVIRIVPGVPTVTHSGSNYVYRFDKLKVYAPKGTLIKNVVVQFTSEIEANDVIKAPTTNSQFQLLPESTVANQSINCTNADGYSAEVWENYLQGVTITLSSTKDKTMRFSANAEGKAKYIYDYNSVNKHYYQLVVLTQNDFINGRAPRFSEAYQAIEVEKGYQYMGHIGYMVTVTTEQEMKFVTSVIKNGDFVWLGATAASPYIDKYLARDGYSSNPNSYTEGLFYWVSGPEKGSVMWKGNRREGHFNNRGYPTYWLDTNVMEYNLLSGCSDTINDHDGLYVATWPTKATYWVWANQPEDVNEDGKQGYQKQIINWMIEYDDIPEGASETHTIQSITLDPKKEPIAIQAANVKYQDPLQIVVTKSNDEKVTNGLSYEYYTKAANGQYTVKLDKAPTEVGDYMVVVSGEGYTTAEANFSILPLNMNIDIPQIKFGDDLDITVKDENGKPLTEDEVTYTYYKKDNNGDYTIKLDEAPTNPGDYKVVVSGEGYVTQEKELTIKPLDIVVDIPQIKFGDDLDITVKDENGKPLTEDEVTYTYYEKDDNGDYTIKLDEPPTNAGDYKVVVSGDGYKDIEKTFKIEPKPLIISALGNNKYGMTTIQKGGKLSDIQLGNDLTVEKLISKEDIAIFGEPEYTWYDKEQGKKITDPNKISLKENDIYVLKVSFPNISDEKRAANYEMIYNNFTLFVAEKNHITDQIIIDTKNEGTLSKEEIEEILKKDYPIKDDEGHILTPENIIIYDENHQDITEKGIDLSKPGNYIISVTVIDTNGNVIVIDYEYHVKGNQIKVNLGDSSLKKANSIKTGDDTMIVLWITMLFVSGCMILKSYRKCKE